MQEFKQDFVDVDFNKVHLGPRNFRGSKSLFMDGQDDQMDAQEAGFRFAR